MLTAFRLTTGTLNKTATTKFVIPNRSPLFVILYQLVYLLPKYLFHLTMFYLLMISAKIRGGYQPSFLDTKSSTHGLVYPNLRWNRYPHLPNNVSILIYIFLQMTKIFSSHLMNPYYLMIHCG